MSDDELLAEFLTETETNLNQFDSKLATLSVNPADAAAAADACRAFHTLAGTCGFFGFQNLGRLARSAEWVLAAWRDAHLSEPVEAAAALREAAALVRDCMVRLRGGGSDQIAAELTIGRLNKLSGKKA